MDESRVIGVRDPNGFRPLCLGKLEHGWVLASESPALDIVGAHFVRELDPGEMVVIDATGPRSVRPFPSERVDPKLCLFEFVYFARPDTRLYNQSVHRSEEHTSELQSLMRISYAVFCLNKKTIKTNNNSQDH